MVVPDFHEDSIPNAGCVEKRQVAIVPQHVTLLSLLPFFEHGVVDVAGGCNAFSRKFHPVRQELWWLSYWQ